MNLPLTDGLLGPNEIKEIYPLSVPLTFVPPLAEDPERQSPEPLEQERQAAEEEEGERPRRGQRGCGVVPDILGKVS